MKESGMIGTELRAEGSVCIHVCFNLEAQALVIEVEHKSIMFSVCMYVQDYYFVF